MAFNVNETIILGALDGGGLSNLIGSAIVPSYGIYNALSGGNIGEKILPGCSVIRIEPRKESRVTTAPTERADYTSFNKVKLPRIVDVVVGFQGWTAFSGRIPNLPDLTLTSRTETLTELDRMADEPGLYDLETPDTYFRDMDLVRYDYRITATEGQTLLTANLIFQQVFTDVATLTMSHDGNANQQVIQQKAGATDASMSDITKAISSAKKALGSALVETAGEITTVVAGVGYTQQAKEATSRFVEYVL
ncbi:hypothetical protein DET57_114169 [Klebsiella oxytoca]|uniref:Phage tail protein n=1 Tax=Klebsiella oxytoca TaxID=571 RepID=A0A318FGG4_KLEOX|nr:hypothetical protein [Klebsiella oxytoca]PXW42177.1 hypothetical protein DET57_114169 [Klebsiella oxytoca]